MDDVPVHGSHQLPVSVALRSGELLFGSDGCCAAGATHETDEDCQAPRTCEWHEDCPHQGDCVAGLCDSNAGQCVNVMIALGTDCDSGRGQCDGNGSCQSIYATPTCGNGILESAEACDKFRDPYGCDSSCELRDYMSACRGNADCAAGLTCVNGGGSNHGVCGVACDSDFDCPGGYSSDNAHCDAGLCKPPCGTTLLGEVRCPEGLVCRDYVCELAF